MEAFPREYPGASPDNLDRRARGAFPDNRPSGVVVHHAAHRNVVAVTESLDEEGYGYHLLIDTDGRIIQLCYLDQKCWHAGAAKWRGKSPNAWFAAVSLMSWGKLTVDPEGGCRSFSGKLIPPASVALRPTYYTKKVEHWDAATPAQEKALLQVLRWFMAHGVSAEDICGHDECCIPPGRKEDPGGVLSLTMAELRATLAP